MNCAMFRINWNNGSAIFFASDRSICLHYQRLLICNKYLFPSLIDFNIESIPTIPEKAAITVSISLSSNNSSKLSETNKLGQLFKSFFQKHFQKKHWLHLLLLPVQELIFYYFWQLKILLNIHHYLLLPPKDLPIEPVDPKIKILFITQINLLNQNTGNVTK